MKGPLPLPIESTYHQMSLTSGEKWWRWKVSCCQRNTNRTMWKSHCSSARSLQVGRRLHAINSFNIYFYLFDYQVCENTPGKRIRAMNRRQKFWIVCMYMLTLERERLNIPWSLTIGAPRKHSRHALTSNQPAPLRHQVLSRKRGSTFCHQGLVAPVP